MAKRTKTKDNAAGGTDVDARLRVVEETLASFLRAHGETYVGAGDHLEQLEANLKAVDDEEA